jgi:hypothetical protein
VKSILIDKYGWPENFKQEDWARDAEDVWDGIIRKSLD